MLYFSTGPQSCSNFCEKSPSQNGQSSWGETLVWELHQCLVPSCFDQACRYPLCTLQKVSIFYLCIVWTVKLALISYILNLERLWPDTSLLETVHSKMKPVPNFGTSRRGKGGRYGYFPCGTISWICQGIYRSHVSEGINESGFPKTQFSSITARYTSFILASNCSRVATPWVMLG